MTFFILEGTQMALPWTKDNVEIPRVPRSEMTQELFDAEYLHKNRPVIITRLTDNLDCNKWNLNYLKKIEKKIHVRGKTDLESYRKGTKYCIHETTMAEYIDDLQTGHVRVPNKSYNSTGFILKIGTQNPPIESALKRTHKSPLKK